MPKRKSDKLKLPDDFLGTVTAFLNAKPPEKRTKPKKAKDGKRTRKRG